MEGFLRGHHAPAVNYPTEFELCTQTKLFNSSFTMDSLNSKASRGFAVVAKALGRSSEKAILKHSRQRLGFGK